MSKKIILLTTLIIATLLLTSTISASTDDLTIEYTQHDLNMSNITSSTRTPTPHNTRETWD